MMHKYFGGVVPEANGETTPEIAIGGNADFAIQLFNQNFESLNFSAALQALWGFVAQVDGYLTANAPWKKPADRSDEDHTALQARVLTTAAEAIRIITALVYPILPDAAGKVWRQLGLGEIADAAQHAFLTNVAWGGLKAGTKFGEPAPLFPRAEKDATDRMQKLEEDNNKNAVEAASRQESASPRNIEAVVPSPATASPSVSHVTPTNSEEGASLTATTTAPQDGGAPVATAKVHQVPNDVTSSRLSSTPVSAPASTPAPPAPPAEGAAGATAEDAFISIDDFAKVELASGTDSRGRAHPQGRQTAASRSRSWL